MIVGGELTYYNPPFKLDYDPNVYSATFLYFSPKTIEKTTTTIAEKCIIQNTHLNSPHKRINRSPPMPHTLTTAPCNRYPPSARHYHPTLSIWLSVDPMSDKYPSMSPYTYCGNNPVKLVDPNGREIVIKGENGSICTYIPGGVCESTDKQILEAWKQLDNIYNSCEAGKDVIGEMSKNDSPLFTITNDKGKYDNAACFKANKDNGGTLFLNGRIGEIKALSHELFHGYQQMNNQGGLSCHNEVEAQLFSFLVCGHHDLHPYKAGIDTEYGKSFLRFLNKDFSNFDEDFKIFRDGFLEYSMANYPGTGREQGFYSKLKTPKGDKNVFLLSKYFQKYHNK